MEVKGMESQRWAASSPGTPVRDERVTGGVGAAGQRHDRPGNIYTGIKKPSKNKCAAHKPENRHMHTYTRR